MYESSRVNCLRVGQTRRQLSRLRAEICDWRTRRRRLDVRERHATQLRTLQQQFEFMLGEIERSLGEISLAPPPLQAYTDCRKADCRLLVVRRLGQYFRDKFGQRDDDRLKAIPVTADEVIWSGYVQPVRKAKAALRSVPLPYIGSFCSPSAVSRDQPPQDLRSDVDAEFLDAIPGFTQRGG
ncbi:hypothetical protein [Bradyrhizobium sp. STM 3843]|uniref:hypothetical protein n=1 Tax=Bradyrhizobium sp. STM 3843 TaxID=551947 RepID=UPI001112B008|nr:hypothetical protein [Bradyrhizobium sp. STM 3843]